MPGNLLARLTRLEQESGPSRIIVADYAGETTEAALRRCGIPSGQADNIMVIDSGVYRWRQ